VIDDGLREELSALIDGVLPEERAKELRQRIREEPDLFREYAELERTVHAVRALPRRGAPPDLRARVRASIGGRRSGGRIFRLGALAAAATVLLALGLALYLRKDAPVHYEAREDKEEAMKREVPAPPAAPAEVAEAADQAVPADAEAEPRRLGKERDIARAQPLEDKSARAGAKKVQDDLLESVVKAHAIAQKDRKAYLQQLAALGPEKARAHVRSLFGGESGERVASGPEPVLATIQLADREEATLVQKILGTAPAPSKEQAATSLAAEAVVKDQLNAEVRGTPAELWRLEQWLSLLDLEGQAAKQPKAVLFGESKGGAPGAKAAEPQVRSAIVRLKFGKPPEPETKEAPPGER